MGVGGRVRLRMMADWITTWSNGDIYTGGDPIGTVGATYCVSIEMEELALTGEEHQGGIMDLEKMLDAIPRELLYRLARAAGMPEHILSAYKRYQQELRIRNAIGKSVGENKATRYL